MSRDATSTLPPSQPRAKVTFPLIELSTGPEFQPPVNPLFPVLPPPPPARPTAEPLPLPLFRIFLSRQSCASPEFLCSLDDGSHFQMCKWVGSDALLQLPNHAALFQEFNERDIRAASLFCDYGRAFNSPRRPVEVICQRNSEFLFRVSVSERLAVFVWDSLNDGPWDGLIQDFMTPRTVKVFAEMSPGTDFLLAAASESANFLFESPRRDVVDFVARFHGTVLLAICESDFDWWCSEIEGMGIRVVGYRHDEFARGVIRQFQLSGLFKVVLVPYAILSQDFRFLACFRFDLLLLDNAGRIRNPASRKLNAAMRMQSKSRGVCAETFTPESLDVLGRFLGPDHLGFRSEPVFPMKYLFLPILEHQRPFVEAAQSEWESLKCCQHPRLVQPCETSLGYLDSLTLLSSKFSFLFAFVKENYHTYSISIVFRSKSLKKLFMELCDGKKITYGAESFLTLCQVKKIIESEFTFGVDCDVPRGIRLVTADSLEQRIVLEEKQICAIDSNFEIVADFDAHSCGYTGECLTKNDLREFTHDLETTEGWSDNALMFMVAMLRSLDPPSVFDFPLILFQLGLQIPAFDHSFVLCARGQSWLKPVRPAFPTIEKFKRFRSVFRRSHRILTHMETQLIVRGFGGRPNLVQLPPSHRYSRQEDSRIFEAIIAGQRLPNCDDRVEAIVSPMKSELIMRDFPARLSFQFWTRQEILQLLRALAAYGAQITNLSMRSLHAKTGILTKTGLRVQLWASELTKLLTDQKETLEPISLHVGTPDELVKFGIPETIVLPRDDYRDCLQKMTTNTLLRNAISAILARNTPTAAIEGHSQITYGMCSWLFDKLVEFGVSSRTEFVLCEDGPIRAVLSYDAVNFLTGMHVIPTGVDQEFTGIVAGEATFQRLLRIVATEPTDKQGKPHSLSLELLERAATLQKQKEAERKVRVPKPPPAEPVRMQPVTWTPEVRQMARFPVDTVQQLAAAKQPAGGPRKSHVKSSQLAAMQMSEDFLKTLPHRQPQSPEPPKLDPTPPLANPPIPVAMRDAVRALHAQDGPRRQTVPLPLKKQKSFKELPPV
jgi:hypothetical protein